VTFNAKDMARVRELLAIPDEIGSQVNKASFAQEAALRKRDAEVFKLARKLIETRDARASRAVFEHVRANGIPHARSSSTTTISARQFSIARSEPSSSPSQRDSAPSTRTRQRVLAQRLGITISVGASPMAR
jgi:hypothetical protein